VGNIDVTNESFSLRYRAPQRNDGGSDQRLNTVTEFTSRILELIPQLDRPSFRDLQETGMTLERLCHGLNGRDFSRNDQQRFADVLHPVLQAHHPGSILVFENNGSTGMLRP
jgi:hypothetical protein